MSKHTPGPWEVKEVKTQIGRAFKINEIGIDTDHGCLACIYDDNTTLNERQHDEHEANVHLIASAPELLEVCKDLFAYYSQAYKETDLTPYQRKQKNKAKQAIAKAEGLK